jgi:hypothetical protein
VIKSSDAAVTSARKVFRGMIEHRLLQGYVLCCASKAWLCGKLSRSGVEEVSRSCCYSYQGDSEEAGYFIGRMHKGRSSESIEAAVNRDCSEYQVLELSRRRNWLTNIQLQYSKECGCNKFAEKREVFSRIESKCSPD